MRLFAIILLIAVSLPACVRAQDFRNWFIAPYYFTSRVDPLWWTVAEGINLLSLSVRWEEDVYKGVDMPLGPCAVNKTRDNGECAQFLNNGTADFGGDYAKGLIVGDVYFFSLNWITSDGSKFGTQKSPLFTMGDYPNGIKPTSTTRSAAPPTSALNSGSAIFSPALTPMTSSMTNASAQSTLLTTISSQISIPSATESQIIPQPSSTAETSQMGGGIAENLSRVRVVVIILVTTIGGGIIILSLAYCLYVRRTHNSRNDGTGSRSNSSDLEVATNQPNLGDNSVRTELEGQSGSGVEIDGTPVTSPTSPPEYAFNHPHVRNPRIDFRFSDQIFPQPSPVRANIGGSNAMSAYPQGAGGVSNSTVSPLSVQVPFGSRADSEATFELDGASPVEKKT